MLSAIHACSCFPGAYNGGGFGYFIEKGAVKLFIFAASIFIHGERRGKTPSYSYRSG